MTLDYRNIAEADVKVYPVDLMRLYLTRRNLDAIAGIDLAGITPAARDRRSRSATAPTSTTRSRPIDLPLEKEGAYLVMVRGDEPVRLGDRAGHARWSWRSWRRPTPAGCA